MNLGSTDNRGSVPFADGELLRSNSYTPNDAEEQSSLEFKNISPGRKDKQEKKYSPGKSTHFKVVLGRVDETVKKPRRKKRWKKQKDKPNRPLSAYNLFFSRERAVMLGDDAPSPEEEARKKRVHCRTHGKIGFADMAKIIGAKWKTLQPQQKMIFEELARKEKERYQVELVAWKDAQKRKACASGEQSNNTGRDESIPLATSILSGRMYSFLPMVAQADHIRTLQELPFDQSARLGVSQRQMLFESSWSSHAMQHQLQQSQQYPSAAEHSGATLLNHFQQGGTFGMAFQPQSNIQTQNIIMDQELFQEFTAMRRRLFATGGYGMNATNAMNNILNMNMSIQLTRTGAVNSGMGSLSSHPTNSGANMSNV